MHLERKFSVITPIDRSILELRKKLYLSKDAAIVMDNKQRRNCEFVIPKALGADS
jgi:hypothetical protein